MFNEFISCNDSCIYVVNFFDFWWMLKIGVFLRLMEGDWLKIFIKCMYSSFFVEGFNEYLDKKSVVYSVLLIG